MTPSDTSLGAQRPPLPRPRRDRVPSAGWAVSLWDWAIIVLLTLLVALFFWRILTPNLSDRASFPPGDFSYQFWAFSTFEARELSAGRLPLWNPYTYAGAPFWADIQSAVLYPPSLLTLLLSGPWGFSLFALEVEAIAHFWLAGVFTYLFVRRLTRHRGAALFAAITFTFGGYLTGYPSQQLAVLETDVWLPLVLYFADRALVDRSGEAPRLHPQISLPDTLAAGLSWGMALLAGHPQSTMFTFYAFTLYVMFLVLALRSASPPEGKWRIRESATYWVLVILIGLGISAIAWLPGLEYMRLSVRAAGFYDKMSGGFPLYDPIQMLLPGSVSFYSPLYVGVLPLLLAVWAALSLRQRETIFWGALAAGAFLLSFGDETFLYTPFYLLIPGFSIFRDQERLAFVVSFALAVLAGYGFKYQISNIKYQISNTKYQILSQRNRESDNQTIRESGNREIGKLAICRPAIRNPQSPIANLQSVVGWLLVGAVGLVVLFFYALNSVGWLDESPFNLLLSRSVWLTILLALTWGAMWATRSWGLRAKNREPGPAPYSLLPTPYSLLPISFLLIAALDLFTVNWKTNIYPALPETQTAMPAVVQAIQTDASPGEVFRVYNEYRIYENYGIPYALEDTWGASPLRLARYDEIHRSLRMERLWELLNVKYVITWRKELYAPSEIIYQEPAGDDVTYVHRLSQVAPRAWLVYEGQTVGEDATLARLDAFDFDPAQAALVPLGTPLPLENPPDGQNGQVEILHRTPRSMVLNVTAPTNRLLVLSEVYYPGWRATVDGRTTPIVRTDYTLRGVPVPAGEHRVEVFYRPLTFIWGAIISGMTLVAIVVVGLWTWLRRKSLER
jgi:hypothetical protein